ncbi:MAG: hypothetical protein JO354_11830 [Verrucomicrobia bacterium]|nr:hypothetical protein [Verrucomicrobiota bacterium]
MSGTVLTGIALTGFAVAFLHAAIPTHWLPFVATGRVQGWNHARTLAITALAGTGHVLATAALGLLLTIFGVALSARVGVWFPRVVGGLLMVLGLFFILRQFVSSAHSHTHLIGAAHEHACESRTRTSDRVAIGSLFAILTFSPCESFLPIYVSGIRFGWSGFALLTLVLSVATVAGMLFFTWVTLAGIRNFRLRWLERHENAMMGGVLLAVGVLVMLFEK